MRKTSLLRDLGIAVLCMAGLVAAYYIFVFGLMTLMMLSFVAPVGLLAFIVILFFAKKKKR